RDKVLDIDLTTREIKILPVEIESRRHYLGGKGLALRLLYDHLNRHVIVIIHKDNHNG
ncbi:MAG: hypothetical protein KAS98_09855, partial [Deltaproteobacteria bacterium]|nr:hypothetical protein [Deltaproteobacteria bacterium]